MGIFAIICPDLQRVLLQADALSLHVSGPECLAFVSSISHRQLSRHMKSGHLWMKAYFVQIEAY